MVKKALLVLSLAVVSASAVAQSESPARRNTFWILGPFGVEHQLGADDSRSALGIYLAGVLKDEGGGSGSLQLGPAVEYLSYSAPNASGIGFGGRVTFASGTSFAPSLAYVTRPRGAGTAFRLGLSFPLGQDVVPFNFELAVGFRF